MNFIESSTVELMSDDLCRFAESGLKWSKLVAIAKF
jgi:hypothetical protein